MKSASAPLNGESISPLARTSPTFLAIDRIVEKLSALLTGAGARSVEATVADSTARVVLDEGEMDQAFASLSHAVAPGAAVTILGGLVQIETGERLAESRCALLCVSVRDGQAAARTGVQDGLSVVRGFIKKHSGFLRLWKRGREMKFNFYLPVLH